MNDFIDLKGASGAEYRFRIWPEAAAHVPTAGNYIIVKEEADSFTILLVGVTNDLSRAPADGATVARRGATHIFTRPNVMRALRTAEHADLAAAYKGAVVSEGV